MLENARLEAEEAGLSTTDPIRAARDEDTALATIMHTLLRKGEPQQALDAFDCARPATNRARLGRTPR